jgi:hypothetical protein
MSYIINLLNILCVSGGLGPLGALFGSLFTLLPLPRLGSRRTVAAFAAPALILSWIIIAFSNSVETIYIGRFLGMEMRKK